MANIKFSAFTEVTDVAAVTEIVGYNGTQNVRITPANFVTTAGPFLPLAGGTMIGNTIHNDNVKSIYGTASDGLEIFYDGANTNIDAYNGNIIITNNKDNQDIIFKSDDGSGDVIKYFLVNGGMASGGTVYTQWPDNSRIALGSESTQGDLNIYHDSTDSFVNNFTGDMYIQNAADDKDIIFQSDDGSGSTTAYLTLDGSTTDAYFTNPGNVGIGDTSPAKQLQIKGSAPWIRIEEDSGSRKRLDLYVDPSTAISYVAANQSAQQLSFQTGNSDRMRITNAGNVGIGTTSPANNLQVKTSSDGGGITIQRNSSTSNAFADLMFSISTSDSASPETKIRATRGASYDDTDISFITSNTEKMRIDSAGNVGIGTTSPTKNLQITSSGNAELLIERASGAQIFLQAQASAGVIGVQTNDRLDLKTNGATRMSISNTGDVGIGTTSPTAALHIEQNDDAILRLKSTDNKAYIALSDDDTNGYISSENAKLSLGANIGVNANNLNIDLANNRVGIGISSPGRLLTLSGDASPYLSLVSNTTGGSPSIFFGDTDDDNEGRITYSNGQDYMALFTAATEKVRINSDGVLSIGTTGSFSFGTGSTSGTFIQQESYMGISIASGETAAIILRRLEDGTLQRFYNLNSVVGSITVTGSATAYNTSSDYRLKEDLKDFEGLDLVSKIPVYDFKWKTDEKRSYGVMAHELQEVLSDAVNGEKDAEEMQGVDYSKIVPLLIKSIQELSAKVTALENA